MRTLYGNGYGWTDT